VQDEQNTLSSGFFTFETRMRWLPQFGQATGKRKSTESPGMQFPPRLDIKDTYSNLWKD
jgi:hypothetical protein